MIRIHVGCGPRLLVGWYNIDVKKYPVDSDVTPEEVKYLQLDATVCLPFFDSTVDCIYTEDFVEHVNQQQQICFFAECFRVLKPLSWCRVTTPDLNYFLDMNCLNKGAARVDSILWDWGHIAVLNVSYAKSIIELFGFKVFFTGKNKSLCKLMPEDIRPSNYPEQSSLFIDMQKP